MDHKNKNYFFILSFFLSLALFVTGQQYLNSDLKAYFLAILSFGLVPVILYFIWIKINQKLRLTFFIVGLLSVIWTFNKVDLAPLSLFLTTNIWSIIGLFVFSIIIGFILKINFKNSWLNGKKSIVSIFESNNFIKYAANILVFLLFFFLIYNPKYKYSFEKLSLFGYESFHQFHHVTFFVIPIHEILNGKTLLINVSSLYGILLTYFNSLVFKIIGLTYSKFVLYSTIFAIGYTSFFFIILKRITKNFWLALIGTLAYIRLAFFRGEFAPNVEVFVFPSTTPIRYFFDLIVFYLVFEYFNRLASLKRLWIMATIVSIGFFFSFDFGLLILLSYFATLMFDICLLIIHKERLKKIINKLTVYSSTLIIPFIILGLLIVVSTFVRSGTFPNFSQYFFHLSTQTVQLNDRSFPTVISWQYLPLLIYLVGFYSIFYQAFFKKEKSNQWLVFLLIYGLLTYTFYINLSEPNHLFSIIHPAILIFVILFKPKVSTSFFSRFISVFFFVSVFWVIFTSPDLFTNMIAARTKARYSPVTNHYYHWNYPGTDFYLQDDNGKNFELAADKIKQLTKKEKEIVIISRYAPILYMMTDKTSLIDHPNIENDFYSVEEFSEAINTFSLRKPTYVFVHSPAYSQWYANTMDLFWGKIKKDYTFKENTGAVDIYQLKK